MQLKRAEHTLVRRAPLAVMLIMALCPGCDVINPSDPLPAYLEIEEIVVDPVPGTGTTAQRFEEVWLYVNGTFAGAYSVPAKIPVIHSGEAFLQLFAGIRVNGIRSVAGLYPYFVPYEVQSVLTPGESTVLDMHTRYRSNVVMALLEDFEAGHQFTDDLDEDKDTEMVRTTSDVFEGSGAGLIVLTDTAEFIQVASVPLLNTLPTNGTPVFLEMHYKNTVEFSIGLVGHIPGLPSSSASILVLRPQENWYKVYVDLTPALEASQLAAYQLLVTAAHDTTQERSEIYLDNLKLVHIAQ